MQLTVEWTIRANNRWPGDRETVEATDYINALVTQGRVRVIEVHLDPEPVVEAPLDAVEAEVVPDVDPTIPGPGSAPIGEPGAEGLTVTAKPGPRPRRRPIVIEPVKD